jgi:hypothetical protein
MAPGGYIELADAGGFLHCDDGTMGSDNAVIVLVEHVSGQALARIGRPAATGELMEKRLQDAGFVDIKMLRYKQPFGPWPKNPKFKKLGAWILLNIETAFDAYSLAPLTRILGLSHAEAVKISQDAVAAARNKNVHMYTYQ